MGASPAPALIACCIMLLGKCTEIGYTVPACTAVRLHETSRQNRLGAALPIIMAALVTAGIACPSQSALGW